MAVWRKALVVEDEDDVRELIVTSLEQAGWRVLETDNGAEALLLAENEVPDLIVLDIMMPGMNGLETYTRLRANNVTEHIPVIMLTAVNQFELGNPRDAGRVGEELGTPPPEAFIEKPLNRRLLLEAVRMVTGDSD